MHTETETYKSTLIPGMSADKIKELLELAKVTQTDIADNLDPPVRQSAVNQVIHRRQTSRRIQQRICEIIGKSMKEVWGKE